MDFRTSLEPSPIRKPWILLMSLSVFSEIFIRDNQTVKKSVPYIRISVLRFIPMTCQMILVPFESSIKLIWKYIPVFLVVKLSSKDFRLIPH